MGICYIVGAGECAALPEIQSSDFVIAADGGYDSLVLQSIKPNLLIGDLDSIENVPSDVEILRFEVKKNETDMHLAYLEGVRRGYENFMLFGGTGGRPDHTFANYSLLYYISGAGHRAKLVGKDSIAEVIINEKRSFFGKGYFSVFAFGGTALGVSIENAAYELWYGDLTPDFPLGVSNRFCDTPATVSVKCGALLVMSEK